MPVTRQTMTLCLESELCVWVVGRGQPVSPVRSKAVRVHGLTDESKRALTYSTVGRRRSDTLAPLRRLNFSL